MAIRYEVHDIKNASGSGKNRNFIQLREEPPMTSRQLEEQIEETCTVNAADVRAVLAQLRYFIGRELSAGRKFHLPEIGYLSLAVGNTPPSEKPDGKITAKDIFVRGINFRPEKQLLDEIKQNVRFKKDDGTTISKRYTDEELWTKVKNYISENGYITCRIMSLEFGLSGYMTRKWLTKFTADGQLVKRGSRRQPLYFLNMKEGDNTSQL